MKRCSVIFGTAVLALLWPLVAFAQGLTTTKAGTIFTSCASTAGSTDSVFRAGKKTKMWCAVVNREGKLLLIESTDAMTFPSAPGSSDAWRGSIEIAIAKAYTAMAFSSNDQALDSRTIGLVARTDGPGSTTPADIGTDAGVAPLFGIGDTNPFRSALGVSLGSDDSTFAFPFHHGIVTFAGGQPVYDCSSGHLLGAVGVSGDGVDQDDTVAKGAVTGASFCLTP